jgi:hypothetical protein
MGPQVGTEQYGICSVSPGRTARPPGNTTVSRNGVHPRTLYGRPSGRRSAVRATARAQA